MQTIIQFKIKLLLVAEKLDSFTSAVEYQLCLCTQSPWPEFYTYYTALYRFSFMSKEQERPWVCLATGQESQDKEKETQMEVQGLKQSCIPKAHRKIFNNKGYKDLMRIICMRFKVWFVCPSFYLKIFFVITSHFWHVDGVIFSKYLFYLIYNWIMT